MKKIFTLLAILLVLVLPIVSCSSDDVSAKQAETDRESLEIPNDEDHSNIQFNQLALYVSKTAAQTGEMVTFTTVLNGVDVTNQVSYFINNIQIGGYSIASNFPGTFKVQAKMTGYIDSPVVTVVYSAGQNPNPVGNFIFNGQGYNMVGNILILNGAFIEDGNPTPFSSWTSIVLNDTNPDNATVGAVIDFRTPFTITNPATNEGTIVLPNGTNEVYKKAQTILVNNQNFTNVTGTGTIHYRNLNLEATTSNFTSNISFLGNTLQINYNGAFTFIDDTDAPAARLIKKVYKIQTNDVAKYSLLK